MRTLASRDDRQSILERLETVTEKDRSIWGRMTAHQMLCHLSDSYSVALGERKVSAATGPLQRTLMKWIALNMPLPWPHGVPTRPEIEQGLGGTAPVAFDSDREHLTAIFHRFTDAPDMASIPHPIFNRMNHAEWLRWGYLHADHHLRQFGR